MKAWDVILDGKVIDTVFFDDNCDAEYVRTSLIDHDGYDPNIEVQIPPYHKTDCFNFEREHTLQFDSIVVFDHSQEGAESWYENSGPKPNITSITVSDSCQCSINKMVDGECPKNCEGYSKLELWKQTINYALRCIEVGDGEQTRLWEDPDGFIEGFKREGITDPELLQELRDAIECKQLLGFVEETLKKHISHRDLYENDWDRWEYQTWNDEEDWDKFEEWDEQ